MRELKQGSGQIERINGITRLLRPLGEKNRYSNAQLDDYSEGFLHQAPVSLQVRAAFSHPQSELKGTAGFGFWNAPFAPGSSRLRFPKTAWFFFGSPPLNLPLAMDVPGSGFKVATLDATHAPFFLLLPTAPIGFLLMRNRFLYRHLWKIAQRAIKVSEYMVNVDLTVNHTYRLDWLKNKVDFYVDDILIHSSPYSPTGRMGIVIWLDNQYAIVTPQGNFGWGLIEEAQAQWMDLHDFQITPLT